LLQVGAIGDGSAIVLAANNPRCVNAPAARAERRRHNPSPRIAPTFDSSAHERNSIDDALRPPHGRDGARPIFFFYGKNCTCKDFINEYDHKKF